MLTRFLHVFRKELIQTIRDPPLRALIIFPPVTNILLLGYALSMDVKNIRTAIFDLDNTAASRELVADFSESGYFKVIEKIGRAVEISTVLDQGTVAAVVRIDPGFQEAIEAGRTTDVQLILDGSDSVTAAVVQNYGSAIVRQFAERTLAAGAGRAGEPAVSVQGRAWFNDNLQSRDYYLSSIISTSIFLATLTLTSLGVVREREVGTIEQVMVSPLRSLEFLLGKTAPYALFGLVNLGVMLTLAIVWFDIPVRGNVLWLFGAAVPYLATSVGVGLLISTYSRTQQEAMIASFFVYVPFIFFSGFIYPVASMPEVVQWLTVFNPLTHFVAIGRGILLRGIGPGTFWPQLIALSLIGAVTIALATRRFRKTYV